MHSSVLCPTTITRRPIAAVIALALVWSSACTSLQSRQVSPRELLPPHPGEQITGVTTASGEKVLFDLTYPARSPVLRELKRLTEARDVPHTGRDIAITRSVAYLAAGKHGLVSIDLLGNQPRAFDRLELPGFATDVELLDRGRLLCVAGGPAGVHVLRISQPGVPILLKTVQTAGAAVRLAASDSLAVIALGDAGVAIIDLTDPQEPVRRGSIWTGSASAVALQESIAYVALASRGLSILNLRDPDSPVEIGRLDLPNAAYDVAVDGSFAYVAAGAAGLISVDVSDPREPLELNVLDTPGTAVALTVEPGTAYVANELRGITSVDVSNPMAMRKMDNFAFCLDGVRTRGLAVSGGRLYAACWGWATGNSGLYILSGYQTTASMDTDSLYAAVEGHPFHIALADIERVWLERRATDVTHTVVATTVVLLLAGTVATGIAIAHYGLW